MNKSKPSRVTSAATNKKKQAGTAKTVAKKKPPKKTESEVTNKKDTKKSPPLRKEYLVYIANPDSTINKANIKEQIKSFDTKDLSFQAVLLSIEMTESYRQFNVDSMKEFIDNEFEITYNKAHKILTQARIAFDAGGVDAVGKYTGNALDAMKNLKPEQRKEVLSLALKSNPKSVTKPVIVKAMEELGLTEELGNQHLKTKKKVSQIHSMIKKSENRPEFLANMAQALMETLQVKDIRSIVNRLNTMHSKTKKAK